MRFVIPLLGYCLALGAPGEAASELSLRVVDAATAAPLETATVTLEGRTHRAGPDGRLEVRLAAGPVALDVRAPGYLDRLVDVDGASRSIEVALVPRLDLAEGVEVRASVGPDAPGETPIRPDDVRTAAGGGENVFRLLQTLPGVAGPEDWSNRIAVRGGGPDENLTVMDGVEIHNPYRLFGLTSAFNPETAGGFELSTGGFSAAHGDRLSSLLIVNNRDGSEAKALAGTAALSLTDANAILEGRLPGGSGSWLLSGRRTYYDLVAERFVEQDLPSFGDVQARFARRLGEGRTLTVFGLRSREASDASFDRPEEGAQGAFFSRTRNDVVAATFQAQLGGRGVMRTTASAYTNTDVVDFGGDFRNEARRSNSPGVQAFASSRFEFTWDSTVRDHALRQELTLQAGERQALEGGIELHRLRTRVHFTIPGERNPTDNTSSQAGGAALPDALDSSRSSTRLGAWLQDRVNLSSRLTLQAGLRFDHSSVNARTYVSPRLAGTWAVRPTLRLRAAWGGYTQSPGYEKLVQADHFMDLSESTTRGLASQRARHTVLGMEGDLRGGLFARVEVYHKAFHHLIVGRLETPDETAARIAAYDFPLELADSVPRGPWITTVPTNGGEGRAYGLDLYVRRAATTHTRLAGWASYTYGVARREAYGLRFPFDYDRRHAATVVADLRLGAKLSLSATARLGTGFPRTPVERLRVHGVPDAADLDRDGNREELVPERDPEGRLVFTTDLGGLAKLNSARLPHYERLDLRLTWMPRGPQGRVTAYLDVINVLNRKNAGMLDSRLEFDPTSDRPRLVEEPSGSLPFLPSFGVHVNLF
jgi:hypothetical protein